jgi:hypothetical protein
MIFNLLLNYLLLFPQQGVGRVLWTESNTYCRQCHNGYDKMTYIFGIFMIEYTNSPVEVEEALLHVDMFSTSPLSDRTIREWIRSVHWKTVSTLKRYEELGWGHWFFAAQDLPQCHTPGCQALIFKKAWEHERWMTSCSRTCWWRHEHQMFATTFSNTPQPWFGGY